MRSPAVARLAEAAARADVVRDELAARRRFADHSRRQLETMARQARQSIAHHEARHDAYSRNAVRVYRESLAEIEAEQLRRATRAASAA